MHPLDLHPRDEVSRQAWEAIKQPQQPVFDELPLEYRSRLLEHADHALSGEPIDEGDDPVLVFERKVLEITTIPKTDLSEEVREELVAETVGEIETESEAEAIEAVVIPPEVKEHLDLKGQLPKDFTARAKLHEAGINTYGQLAKCEDLTEIEGIGPAIAKQIVKRLRADTKALNK